MSTDLGLKTAWFICNNKPDNIGFCDTVFEHKTDKISLHGTKTAFKTNSDNIGFYDTPQF